MKRTFSILFALALALGLTLPVGIPVIASEIQLAKDTDPHTPNIYYLGDTIHYVLNVTNPSGNAATNYLSLVEDILPDGTHVTLATDVTQLPGTSNVYYQDYVVDETDLQFISGHWGVRNYLHVVGNDSAGDTIDATTSIVSTILGPQISIEKTVDFNGDGVYADLEGNVAGSTASWNVTVCNTGYDPVYNITVTDINAHDFGPVFDLAAGECKTFTYDEEINVAKINTAMAQGMDDLGNPVGPVMDAAQVVVVDARISVAPNATNPVGMAHNFTVTVEMTDDGTTWDPVIGVNVTASLVGGSVGSIISSPPYTTNSSGQVTVTVNSSVPGTAYLDASASVPVDGDFLSVATDGYGAFVVDNQKRWTNGTSSQCSLTVSSTAGGLVTTPGEGTFTYSGGGVVNLVATPAIGYEFVNWTGDVGAIADVNAVSTTITMNGNYSVAAVFAEPTPLPTQAGVWSRMDAPSMQGWVLAPDSIIWDYSVADGGEIAYAALYSNATGAFQLLKSDDWAATWDDITDAVTDVLDDNDYMNCLPRIATDNVAPDFVAVTLDMWDDSDAADEVHVLISTNGGATFTDTGEVEDGAVSFPDGFYVSDLAVSPEDDGTRDIALGGANSTSSLLFRCTVSGDLPGAWEDTTTYGGWDDAGSFFSKLVTDITFSPSWTVDRTILVTTVSGSGPNDVYLQCGSWGTSEGWNQWSTLGIQAVPIIEDVDMPLWLSNFDARWIAGTTVPSDYDSNDSLARYAWVWVNYYDGDGDETGEMLMVKDSLATSINQQLPSMPWLTNVSYHGTIAEGQAIAGVLGDGVGNYTQCCEGVQVYRNDSIVNMNICCEPWEEACKPPTGVAGMAVSYLGQDKAYAVGLGSLGEYGDESAWSVTFDDGDTWNQLSLIDTYIDYFSDVAVSPDCNKIMLVSVNKESGCQCDSVWFRANTLPEAEEYSGKWLRTWSGALEGEWQYRDDEWSPGGMLRLAPEETTGDTVYLFDYFTGSVYRNDMGTAACWDSIGSTGLNNTVDLALQDADTFFALDDNGEVAMFDSDQWQEPIASGLDTGHTIAVRGDHVLVGGNNGEVSYSDDGGGTFDLLETLPAIGGWVTVGFDTYFDTNMTVYAATDEEDNTGGIYSWVIGESEDWKDLEAVPLESQLGIDDGDHEDEPVEVAYTGLVVDRPSNPFTSPDNGGVLYASYYGYAYDESMGWIWFTGAARSLARDVSVCAACLPWDFLHAGLSVDVEGFEAWPDALKICGCLTPDTNIHLFAIDEWWEYDMFENEYGSVWTYEDCYAKKAPEITNPADGTLIPVDPSSCYNGPFTILWDSVCNAGSYDIAFAMDEDFTMPVMVNGEPDPAYPIVSDTPSFSILGGPEGGLSCETTYYVRVRAAGAATGEIIHSWWSSPIVFRIAPSVEAGTIDLISPATGAVNQSVEDVGFSWDLEAAADSFDWVLSANADLSSPIDTKTGLTDKATSYAGTLAYGTTYYWQVAAYYDGFCISTSAVGTFTTANFTEEVAVTFADANLEAAIRDAIGKPTGDIYESDLLGLTSLYAGEGDISNLSGLEHCTNLTSLYLWNNEISDISPVTNLTNLIDLNLYSNQISDISPVTNLTNLIDLNLYSNQINDISPVTNLTNLTGLDLSGNQISDVSPLANLTNLTGLGLWGNQISDITPLANLTNLTGLWLDANQISDISPLTNLTNLTGLNLGGNHISDVALLAGLTNLTWLHLYSNQISDIAPLASLTSLTEFELQDNQISDISPLSSLTSLIWLDLGGNHISDISVLASLTNLTDLHLWTNQISDISPLANLTSLTQLGLDGNLISDITPLANLTGLTYLRLNDNQISDISPVANLTGLTGLFIWHDEIDDFSPLAGLTNLTELDVTIDSMSDITLLPDLGNLTALGLSVGQISDAELPDLTDLTNLRSLEIHDNQISDISPLANLTNLTGLYLWSNQISDISPLTNLINLTDLNLDSNQITDISPVANLTGLTSLRLNDNQLSDISALASLTGLTGLFIWHNEINDFSPLANLTNLTELDVTIDSMSDIGLLPDLSNLTALGLSIRQISDAELPDVANLTNLRSLDILDNQISDISPLAGLASLTGLDLGGNRISDIAPVADLTNLTDLNLDGNRISDISPLTNLTSLTYLRLNDNQISGISALASLTNLMGLYLWNNEINDLSPLAGLTNLTELDVTINSMSDATFLSDLTNLEALGLSIGQISDAELPDIAELTNLRSLEIHDNQISNITPLASLTNLTGLYLWSNQISDVSPLTDLTNLTDLNLDGNQITDISPVANLTGLTYLRLNDNQLSDISALAGLTGLTGLSIWHNDINDFSPLVSLTNLTELDVTIDSMTDITLLPDLSNLTALGLSVRQISDAELPDVADLTNLRSLDIHGNQISDIAPLGNVTNLTGLDLGGNQISDVSPLANLTKLTWLSLWANQISDIAPLAYLANLTNLDLGGNQIGDISPLGNITSLTGLSLWGNQISDIGPLANLTGLTGLGLDGNQISDVSPVANLTDLTDLNLGNNQISDVSPLASLTNLTWLYLGGNQISNITPLTNLTNLTGLDLGANQINDISSLVNLTGLTQLGLNGNQISNISPLSSVTNLTGLDLGGNQISDISPLANLTGLTHLGLNGNQISNVSPLSSVTNLTGLDLGGNEISDISPLANLTDLTGLDLGGNQISDISPLANLANLTDLGLSGNQIGDISPLANLTGLTQLDLYGNQVSDVGPLGNLTNLTWLYLYGSQISDITPLGNLTNLIWLYLYGSQISDISPLANLTSLTGLYLWDSQISDISPVANLTSLTGLYLGSSQISDIAPLANLTNLTGLYLQDNQINDISPLANLTSLTWLYLGGNQISDIASVANLTNLTGLDLGNNQISDAWPLADLTNLTYLSLGPNQISDIAPLTNLTGLTQLHLDSNNISDILPLANLTNLTDLGLASNQISDISPLADLGSLTGLNLQWNQASDISSLANLTDLIWLSLEGNQISDVAALSNLISLTGLDLRTNQISDISALADLTNLGGLSLGDNNLTDIAPLSGLINLTWLMLPNNQISDISPLADLNNLTWLHLGSNNVSDIAPLANLTNLMYLYLHDNQIGDISPLGNFTGLSWLTLWNNEVSDVSPVANLTNLAGLELGENQISDISPLVENGGLSEGDYVDLRWNPLSEDSINIYIPQLEERGVKFNPEFPLDEAEPCSLETPWIKNPDTGNYYALTAPMSWMAAEACAEVWGGHLVTLNSGEEELWIKDVFGRDEQFWIGLYVFGREHSEENFIWSSGEPVTYSSWASGEPNNCGGWENAAVMNYDCDTDYWNDLDRDGRCRGMVEVSEVPGGGATIQYSLTVSSTSGGTATAPGEGTYIYDEGTVVDLVAGAEEGYQFANWTGNVGTIADINAASTTITMNDSYSIAANFEEVGAICPTISPTTGQYNLDNPDAVATNITWNDASVLSSIDDGTAPLTAGTDYAVAGNTLTIMNAYLAGKLTTIDQTLELIVSFDVCTPASFTITALGTQPSISPTTAQYNMDSSADVGATVTWGSASSIVSIVDDDGHILTGTQYAVTPITPGVSASLTIRSAQYLAGKLMDIGDEVVLTIEFNVGDNATLEITAIGINAMISPQTREYDLNNPADVWATITWGSASSVASIVDDDEHTLTGTEYTLTPVTPGVSANLTILSSYLAGKLTDIGDNITLTIDFDLGADAAFTITAISEEPPIQYDVTISSTAGGLVTSPGEGTFLYGNGTVINLVAEADVDYSFANWTATAGTFGNATAAETTFTMPAENATVTAHFELVPPTYTLAMATDPAAGGTATDLTEGSPYLEGGSVSIRAQAATGYTFVNWTATGGTFGNATAAETIFTMPAENATVTAHFEILPVQYGLTVASTGGGATIPTAGTHTCNDGDVVALTATPASGYQFVNWTGDAATIADVNAASTTITMNGNYSITANFAEVPPETGEIYDWYDLDAVRDNLDGNYTLMNDLDSTTAGYGELAGPTANGGEGWEPIGSEEFPFTGSFDGQGYEIKDLFIDRPDETEVGLFGFVYEGGIIKNIGVMNATVTGRESVGGLLGVNCYGAVSDSYSSGSVTGNLTVGGLAGVNYYSTLSNSYSTGSVTGNYTVGGLVGMNCYNSTVSNSYSTGSVIGNSSVGGLLGVQSYWSTVSNSYAAGSVTGNSAAGGLTGQNYYNSTVSNSYATGSVIGNDNVGGLVGMNFHSSTVSDSYSTGSVSGDERVGGLVGLNDWSTVNHSYSTGSVTGELNVGGLVGYNNGGTVSNSFWDTETSGQATSDGGTGKTTAEMMNIDTFSNASWSTTAVAPGVVFPSYSWNVIDGQIYPFLSWEEGRGAPATDSKTETVTENGTVDAMIEADTEVVVTGNGTVTVTELTDNPGQDLPTDLNPLDKYIDVYVPDTDQVTQIEIKLYYTDAEVAAANLTESSLRLLWWDGEAWVECSDTGVSTQDTGNYSGYIWAEIRADTTPTLADLSGDYFTAGGLALPPHHPTPPSAPTRSAPSPTIQYELTIVSTADGSVIGPAGGTSAYEAGETVNLVAEPPQGYRFVNWTGDVDTVDDVNAAETTIIMEGDCCVTANFIAQYDLTVGNTLGGSVTAPTMGTHTYDAGTVVDLVAEAEEGYRFVSWTTDAGTVAEIDATPIIDNSDAATTTIIVEGDCCVTANFIAQYNLTIDSTDGGKVTTPGEGTFVYDAGTVVDLLPEAEEGWQFVNWTGDVATISELEVASTIIMNTDYRITASFKPVMDWRLIGGIIGVVVAAGLLSFFLLRRRRRAQSSPNQT